MTRRRRGGPLHRPVPAQSAADRQAQTELSRLSAIGEALSADDIREWLSTHGKDDPEVAHALIDELLFAALRSIRDGHPDPAGLARAVLTIADADFPTWFARASR